MSLLVLASGVEAAQPKCLIVGAGPPQSTLQAAVDAASAGDTLKVKGTCDGDATISKNLTIIGQSNLGFGAATLNGANPATGPGSVVTVNKGVTAIVIGLNITGGNGSPFVSNGYGNTLGGGVLNYGSLTLIASTASGNTATEGSGLYNAGGSVMLNHSTVSNNTAPARVGGIGIYSTEGSLTLNNSTVSGNSGIGIFNAGAQATLNNSTVSGNSGTGVENNGSESLVVATLNDSTVSDNGNEGVINAEHTHVAINHSTVSGNGGTGITCSGITGCTLTLNNTVVSHNEDSGMSASEGHVTLNNSTVSDNTGRLFGEGRRIGGGIDNYGGFTLNNSTVSGNTASEGGGIYSVFDVTLNDSSVTRNTASEGGGGIYLEASCSGCAGAILNGSSSVSLNTTSGDGGGIYDAKTVTLNDSSSVTRNTAAMHGGGIYLAKPYSHLGEVVYGPGWSGTVSDNIPEDIFSE